MSYVHKRIEIYEVDVYLSRKPSEWRKVRKLLGDSLPKRVESVGRTDFLTKTTGVTLPECAISIYVDVAIHDGDHVQLVDTCAHEAAHAAAALLEQIGHRGDATDEPTAYLIGHLTGWMWSHVGPGRDSA